MFWADKIALELKERKLPLEWVDDMKTPSGKIHVGALRGVVVHDLIYKTLLSQETKVKYTYIFDNHDPMDALPVYLPKEYQQYLGMPLYKVPSPEPGYDNYAQYYAQDFKKVFNAIGCDPEIIWSTDLYMEGKMNDGIKECLDKVEIIRHIYETTYKRKLPENWFPFQVYCPSCGKVSTTRVTAWDGKEASFICDIDRLDWTKGCGFEGKVSPFSGKNHIAGKLSWKVEWPTKWKALGITIEGAGKDHMSKGGSHDIAEQICKEVLHYPVPYPIPYEFFLVGGKKMSSSKGLGSSASEMLEILPPEILRFLMVKTRYQEAINFDPSEKDTIPRLFAEYQEAAVAYFGKGDSDLARIFKLSQVGDEIKKPPLKASFYNLAGWVQMPNAESRIKEFGMEEWARYAQIYNERFAPESQRFELQKEAPGKVKEFSSEQEGLLKRIAQEIVDYKGNPEDFQKKIYEWAKEIGLSSTDAFRAIYISLLDKDYGPKAAWIILGNKEFAKKRFEEISEIVSSPSAHRNDVKKLNKPGILSIDPKVKEVFPSISVGIAIINGVKIEKMNPELEKEKQEVLDSLENLTTEKLGQYLEIQSYRKLYKAMGVDWHSRRPSPEALLRRAALKKGLYVVNTLVDAYNLVVMKHRVSIGAFDLDQINFPTTLRFAEEGEEILLLGDDKPTKYKSTELGYFDQKGGYNIDFNYRDAQRTAVGLSTKNVLVNVDGIYDITPEKVEQVLQQACDCIMKYCGGKVEVFGIETAF